MTILGRNGHTLVPEKQLMHISDLIWNNVEAGRSQGHLEADPMLVYGWG